MTVHFKTFSFGALQFHSSQLSSYTQYRPLWTYFLSVDEKCPLMTEFAKPWSLKPNFHVVLTRLDFLEVIFNSFWKIKCLILLI